MMGLRKRGQREAKECEEPEEDSKKRKRLSPIRASSTCCSDRDKNEGQTDQQKNVEPTVY
jgi:hypothetical protein